MSDVTRILDAIGAGDAAAAEQLLPLVYDELRRLAAARLRDERPGQTLQPTALVHEAYLRLVGADGGGAAWDGRAHFVAAAAEAMRRILVENARRKGRVKHGGLARRLPLDEALQPDDDAPTDLLALDDALTELQHHDAQAAQLVKLRYFAGLSHQEAADTLGVSRRVADRLWTLARTWLHQRLREF